MTTEELKLQCLAQAGGCLEEAKLLYAWVTGEPSQIDREINKVAGLLKGEPQKGLDGKVWVLRDGTWQWLEEATVSL